MFAQNAESKLTEMSMPLRIYIPYAIGKLTPVEEVVRLPLKRKHSSLKQELKRVQE